MIEKYNKFEGLGLNFLFATENGDIGFKIVGMFP